MEYINMDETLKRLVEKMLLYLEVFRATNEHLPLKVGETIETVKKEAGL